MPLLLDDTSVVVGGREAPLFFVSESQINAQIPFELAADKEHAVVVMSAGRFTVAEPLVLATTRPILLTVGTRVLAQRADGVMVTPEAPVEPGERITFFLTGMGHTVPAVASGELPAPSVVPVVRIAPRVTIGGEPAVVHSTELAPDAVGVYRMQVTIPSETAPGLATVQVEQNGVNSNGAELPVR